MKLQPLACSAALAIAVFTASAHATAIYYVDFRATGSANGLSWVNAFTNLHAAFAAAHSGDLIKVACGTYTPDIGHPTRPVGDRLAYWTFPPNTGLSGGYRGLSGGGGSPDDRIDDTADANGTILSGEIGDPATRADNSLALMNATCQGTVSISGVRFTGCYQDQSAGLPQGHNGSALWTLGCTSIHLTDCVFVDNTTINDDSPGQGGAVFISNAPGELLFCHFINNTISGTATPVLCAGLNLFQTNVQLEVMEFTGNLNTAPAGQGGGLYTEQGTPWVTLCTFENNTAPFGGAMFCRDQWQPPPSPLSTRAGIPTISQNTFHANQAAQGGAIYLWSIRPGDNAQITNCYFHDNTATAGGGAVFSGPAGPTFMQANIVGCEFIGNSGGDPTLASCFQGDADLTFTSCTSADNAPGQAIQCRGDFAHVYNSILRGPLSADQPLVVTDPSVPTTLARCNLEGPTLPHFTLDHIQSVDPMFNNRPQRDLEIAYGSPCTDAGDNSLTTSSYYDLQFRTRFQDDPNVPDTGVGTPPIIDIGAYEVEQRGHCPVDFNNDGDVGTDADIEAFFACLAGSCCAYCETADINGDGDVGTDADIEAFFRLLAGEGCWP